MLVLDAGRVVSVDRLVEGVWGEQPPETAVTALHGHVSALRRLLGGVIVTRVPGYVLDVPAMAVDGARFEALLDDARGALAAGRAEQADGLLDDALAMWRGPPLEDLPDAPFATNARRTLEELGVAACEERADAGLALGRAAEIVPMLRELVAEHPLRERPRSQLMLALYRAGRRSEALECYDEARRTLAEELGIEPGETLRRLHEAMLREDPSLSARLSAPATAPASVPTGSVPAPSSDRRRWKSGAVAAAGFVAAVVVVLLATTGSEQAGKTPPALRGAGVVRIDPESLRVVTAKALDGAPSSVAASAGHAWVIDAEDQTIADLDPSGHVRRTFTTGQSPTDLAAVGDDLWVAEGRTASTQSRAPQVIGVAHVAGRPQAVRAQVPLPRAERVIGPRALDQLALSPRSVWVISRDGSLAQIDRRSARVVRTLPLSAVAVTGTSSGAWVLTSDRTALPVDDGGKASGVPLDLPAQGRSIAAGGGAVWVSDPATGSLTGISPQDTSRTRTSAIGTSAGAVAYGHGAVWALDPAGARVVRVDPASGAVTGQVAVGGTPRDISVSSDGVWVTVAPRTAATATACGPLEHGASKAGVVIVADLPLQTGSGRPTDSMARAVASVVAAAGYRAGRHRVGYMICDDSTPQAGTADEDVCAANARAYVADPRIVAEIGPYQSPCAARQIPVAAMAPGGPLAMISPTATDPQLTLNHRPGDALTFTRVIARDDRQAHAMVAQLRRSGHRSVFVLDDAGRAPTAGFDVASHFRVAAIRAGLRVAGRASWDPRDPTAVVRRVARSNADAVYVSGLLDTGAGAVVAGLREQVGLGVTLAGPDLLLPVAALWERSNGAARGMLLSSNVLPTASQPRSGRTLAARLAREQGVRHVPPAALYAAQATQVALDAIARSDGSRASVAGAVADSDLADTPLGPVRFSQAGDLISAPTAILRVRHGGGSHVLLSTDGAQPVAAR